MWRVWRQDACLIAGGRQVTRVMNEYIFGFWGGYFGAIVLTLTGAVLAFVRRLHRIALNAAMAALLSALFVLAFLGGLPIEGEANLQHCLALLSIVVSLTLFYLLLSVLALLRVAAFRRRVMAALAVLAIVAMAVCSLLPPVQALQLGLTVCAVAGLVALVFSFRSALRGDRLAWVLLAGVVCMLLAVAGLGWIALRRGQVPWLVHAFSAVAATAYIALVASVLWTRYHYLIELQEVMAHGPSHDPVTRMRSHSATGAMVGNAFKNHQDDPVPLGMIVVSIGNLPVLQNLYGQAAVNHALFVCAGRLRRSVPAHVDMGRLADDSFLLLVRGSVASQTLLELARTVQSRLSRSVVLHTSSEAMSTARHQTRWEADIGVGVQRVWRVDARAAKAVAMVRGMSRTAWSFPSRVAWYDDDRGEIVGAPRSAR